MSFSYKPLWRKLVDREITKRRLIQLAGISQSTIDNMTKKNPVTLTVLIKICDALECPLHEVVEYYPDSLKLKELNNSTVQDDDHK